MPNKTGFIFISERKYKKTAIRRIVDGKDVQGNGYMNAIKSAKQRCC